VKPESRRQKAEGGQIGDSALSPGGEGVPRRRFNQPSRDGPSAAEGLWTLRAHSPLWPAGGVSHRQLWIGATVYVTHLFSIRSPDCAAKLCVFKYIPASSPRFSTPFLCFHRDSRFVRQKRIRWGTVLAPARRYEKKESRMPAWLLMNLA